MKKMELDLSKNFILFCGPNSTGKTYASYILNAFLSYQSMSGSIYSLDDILKEIEEKREFKLTMDYIQQWFHDRCTYIKEQLGSIFGVSEETKNNLFDKFNIQTKYTELDYQIFLNRRRSTDS